MSNTNGSSSPVPRPVLDAIRSAERVALTGHVTPDADCLGVIGAMKLALEQFGKPAFASLPDGSVASRLRFMTELAGVRGATGAELAACDLLIAMDTAKDSRVNIDGKLAALPEAKVLNIDHHASNTNYGLVNWVEGDRSSSCEMIYELIVALGCRITPEIASLCYAGMHSDTQGFSLSNTTVNSLRVAHELAAHGANIVDVCERLGRSVSPSHFALLKTIYANTRVSADGRFGWSTVTHAEISAAGCHANDIDDQVEVVRSIEGVRVAILFTEGVPGKIRMNFRGDRGLPVLELARRFNGGGHAMAAGAILDGKMDEVVARVRGAAEAYAAGN